MRKYIKVTFPDGWERISTRDFVPSVDRPFEAAKMRTRMEKNEKDEIRNNNYEEIQESF